MSNSVVGAVYAQIINDVVEAVRVDFEEGGFDDAVLGELKAGWQRKLTQMNVAAFPWDPKPVAPAQENISPSETPAPAQAPNPSYAQSQMSPQPSASPLPLPGGPVQQQNANGLPAVKTEPQEPAIKQEPGLQNHRSPQVHPAFPAGAPRALPAQGTAAQRAAQALENQYGARAAASISAIQSGMPTSQMNQVHQAQQVQQAQQAQQAQRPSQQPQQPQQPPQAMSPQQYRQSMAAATMQQRQVQQIHQTQQAQQAQQATHVKPPNGLPASQMDGASDSFEAVMMQRDASGNAVEMGRVEIDELIRDRIMSRAKQMEGGGLMVPLKEATKHRSLATKTQGRNGAAQLDGLDDDMKEEDDADVINSDLDDPEDEQDDDDDDDDSMGHMMLCLYDKVQRVKNKWKCTLKDGVLTVNGREYVFHKATGEYEW